MKRPVLLVKSPGQTKQRALALLTQSKFHEGFAKAHVKVCSLANVAKSFPNPLEKTEWTKKGWKRLVLHIITSGKGHIYVYAKDKSTLDKAQKAIQTGGFGQYCCKKGGEFAGLLFTQIQFFTISKNGGLR